ncbi:MBOAT, membrane-bound O-acyltransferase family-domain-containing protein [Boletus coccyginus]|nr:MBOAT, membrane-bound O-acyltransferase family-domain-containing protein [Boletus coccyginus]
MPTDLRSTNAPVSPFELEEEIRNKKNSLGFTALTVDIPEASKARRDDTPRPLPLWKTPEFFFYYLVAGTVIPYVVWVPINLSSPMHANHSSFHFKLSPGWLFGRQVDNSGAQYRAFRNNVPALAFLVLVYIALKSIYTRSATRSISGMPTDKTFLVPFTNLFAILYLIGLHGTSILKIFIILTANYHVGKSFAGSRAGPIITWIFNFLILFANERNEGIPFFQPSPWFGTIGLYPRWQISFNITMLRLVSFNMDYYWACTLPHPLVPESTLTEKQRSTFPHSLEHYTYCELSRLCVVPPRIYCCLLTMEFILHYMYVVAIKDTKAWQGDTPLELSMIGFLEPHDCLAKSRLLRQLRLFALTFALLQLLLPWRFFRLWSLASGIDPPENMVRCFWRSWHRSYNLWIVRYIYIPLGGAKNMAITTVLIFTFVALWHDLSLRLLAWGWLELLAAKLVPQSKYGHARMALVNVFTTVAANLVGFVIGTDWNSVHGQPNHRKFSSACGCLFVGVQLMFEYREEEMRRGIFRRC